MGHITVNISSSLRYLFLFKLALIAPGVINPDVFNCHSKLHALN